MNQSELKAKPWQKGQPVPHAGNTNDFGSLLVGSRNMFVAIGFRALRENNPLP